MEGHSNIYNYSIFIKFFLDPWSHIQHIFSKLLTSFWVRKNTKKSVDTFRAFKLLTHYQLQAYRQLHLPSTVFSTFLLILSSTLWNWVRLTSQLSATINLSLVVGSCLSFMFSLINMVKYGKISEYLSVGVSLKLSLFDHSRVSKPGVVYFCHAIFYALLTFISIQGIHR